MAAAGNLLANDTIPRAMVEAFLSSEGHLGDRLITAMRGALAAGGEAGPVHSAGMLLVDRQDWPLAELRCDWSEDCPIENIAAAWDVYRPQMDDYVTRALDPQPRQAMAFRATNSAGPLPSRPVTAGRQPRIQRRQHGVTGCELFKADEFVRLVPWSMKPGPHTTVGISRSRENSPPSVPKAP